MMDFMQNDNKESDKVHTMNHKIVIAAKIECKDYNTINYSNQSSNQYRKHATMQRGTLWEKR